MVTISITAEAFAAIASTLPKVYEAVPRPDGKDGYLVTLDRYVIERLSALPGPGQSYSDVILTLMRG